jgi:hypothetical protein
MELYPPCPGGDVRCLFDRFLLPHGGADLRKFLLAAVLRRGDAWCFSVRS